MMLGFSPSFRPSFWHPSLSLPFRSKIFYLLAHVKCEIYDIINHLSEEERKFIYFFWSWEFYGILWKFIYQFNYACSCLLFLLFLIFPVYKFYSLQEHSCFSSHKSLLFSFLFLFLCVCFLIIQFSLSWNVIHYEMFGWLVESSKLAEQFCQMFI